MTYIPTESGTGVGTSTAYTNYCAFRLPCGICRQTNAIGPMWNQSVVPTWNQQYEVTCVADVERRSE